VKIRVIFVSLLACSSVAFAEGTKLSQKDLDFFENRIRPIFAENCYKCHSESAEKIKGGLLLDSRDALRKGGETGPAIVLKHPEKSLLIKAVSYADKDLQMPPHDKKLSDQQIADLETWVKMGAPDPRDKGVGSGHNYAIDWDKSRKHWAYQPIRKPSVPQTVDKTHWAKSPVDRFILEKLAFQKLTPSRPADKITLLRRATFDLTGLPPTSKEVDAFLADKSSKAFEKVVDRLLASPHYGERWARYWLDLAQYGDTRGPLGNGRDNRYVYAYTYRDWVVKALNDDMPYDKFLRLQIAADKVPNHRSGDLAAMGFLTLGQRFNNSQNDIIDNRITILCQSTMALTANCARCHDHKFDPIPTKDYYSLHGIFASSTEPKEGPLLEQPKDTPAYREFMKELKVRQYAYDDFRINTADDLGDKLCNKAADYMMAMVNYKKGNGDLTRNGYLIKHDLVIGWGALWENNLRYLEKKKDPVFAPWFAFLKLDGANFAESAKDLSKTVCESNDPKKYNPVVAKLFCEPPSSLEQVASRYAGLFFRINKEWQGVLHTNEMSRRASAEDVPEPEGLPDPAEDEVRDLMYAANSPLNPDDQKLYFVIQRDQKLRKQATELERDLFDLKATHPGSPARAHSLEDAKKAQNSFVLIKGNPGTRGPQVPREFFEILSGPDRTPFTNGSGRLELADAIVCPKNPLTARVIVNRIWLHHFGEGIVRTPDDFGTRSEPPTHPELLDYLASTFMENGWSIKKLHKQIMLSSVYQQSSEEEESRQQADPDNRWLWRMNRHRLDFEAMRDTILSIGGKLDLTVGGPSVKLDSEPYSLRRSIYGYVDRNNLPNMFMAFDFASPDLTTGRRESTIVPQQALFMMNSPLVVEQAHVLAQRPDFSAQPTVEKKIRQLYKVIYQREPTSFELKIALQFIGTELEKALPKTPQASWSYGYGEVESKRTTLFVPMNVFKSEGWQSDEFRKDPKITGARLSQTGGAPGKGYAVIRRWTAPRDGKIKIEGPITHRQKEGAGVVCRVVSSRSGELGKWTVVSKPAPVNLSKIVVKQGDTVDFVVESGKDEARQNFIWTPTIKMEAPDAASNETVEWNAKNDFSGKVEMQRLAPWEKFAQVLLETSELTFVN
jgi:cytochrome c553